MENFLFILEFFGGLILVFAVGWLIGKLLKLDEQYEAMQTIKTRIQKKN
jgi:membrane-associated protease RseP (regulator of RpoE activity)